MDCWLGIFGLPEEQIGLCFIKSRNIALIRQHERIVEPNRPPGSKRREAINCRKAIPVSGAVPIRRPIEMPPLHPSAISGKIYDAGRRSESGQNLFFKIRLPLCAVRVDDEKLLSARNPEKRDGDHNRDCSRDPTNCREREDWRAEDNRSNNHRREQNFVPPFHRLTLWMSHAQSALALADC